MGGLVHSSRGAAVTCGEKVPPEGRSPRTAPSCSWRKMGKGEVGGAAGGPPYLPLPIIRGTTSLRHDTIISNTMGLVSVHDCGHLGWFSPQVIDSSPEGAPADLVTGVAWASWAALGTGWSVGAPLASPLRNIVLRCRLNGAWILFLGEGELSVDTKSHVGDCSSLHPSYVYFPHAHLGLRPGQFWGPCLCFPVLACLRLSVVPGSLP
eukprot:gene14256-biopygen9626